MEVRIELDRALASAAIFFFVALNSTITAQNMQSIQTEALVQGAVYEVVTGKEIPVSNEEFRIVQGDHYAGQVSIMNICTDASGNFFVELPVGTYSLVEAARSKVFKSKSSTKLKKWDNRCLKAKWRKALVVINIENMESKIIRFEKSTYKAQMRNCLK